MSLARYHLSVDAGKRSVDSLFVMAQSGALVEYMLEPRARAVSDKVTDDCMLDLTVTGRMQWNLARCVLGIMAHYRTDYIFLLE